MLSCCIDVGYGWGLRLCQLRIVGGIIAEHRGPRLNSQGTARRPGLDKMMGYNVYELTMSNSSECLMTENRPKEMPIC
jgi:hypothetical protein